MKGIRIAPHLLASVAAGLLLLVAMFGGGVYAETVENRYVHALAPTAFLQKSQGSALQKAAIEQQDLLPVYGASELNYPDPYHASTIFKQYPTGFTIFTVGRARVEPIILLEKLAAIGSELRGKKVVITLSPDFTLVGTSSASGYAFNFSPLDAYELAFSTDLDPQFKQDAAARMLYYEDTLLKYPILRLALERLSDGSPSSLVLYYALLPLGKLETLVMRLQDHWETINYIQSQVGLKAKVARKSKTIDWAKLLADAQSSYAHRSNSNPFGIENEEWAITYDGEFQQEKNTLSDKWFLAFMGKSKGWQDLDLLLRELEELGAVPLIISSPIHGTYFDYLGVSAAARQTYYNKLRQIVGEHGVPILDFADHDEDKGFLIDPLFHLSSVGWVYYAHALDAFYHHTLR